MRALWILPVCCLGLLPMVGHAQQVAPGILIPDTTPPGQSQGILVLPPNGQVSAQAPTAIQEATGATPDASAGAVHIVSPADDLGEVPPGVEAFAPYPDRGLVPGSTVPAEGPPPPP